MPIDLIATALDLIIGQGLELAKDKGKRSETILKVLNAIGLKQDAPPANDFNGVYAYTLVVYGIDKPKAILEFFRHPFIKDAFRESFEKRNLSILKKEAENFLDWNRFGEYFRTIDFDPGREFNEFQAQFKKAVDLTRSVHDVFVDHKLDDIQSSIEMRPTAEDIRKAFQPVVEKLSYKEKKLDGERLKAIANESLDRHRERFSFSKDNEKAWEIPRDIHTTIVESLLQSSKPIIGIMGPSGIGKSTLLRQIGRDINSNNGGIALWIPAEDIPSVISVDELLHNVLHRYDATLNNDVSFDALELSSHTNKGLLLLVDDINRAARPDQILSSISALSANATAKDTPIHFVVPLWQGQIAVSPNSREAEKHWEIINLAYFSEAESKEYSRLISPKKTSNTQQLIASLGGDPFLVGLATEEFEKISSKEPIDLLNEIFKYTIDEAIRKAREASNELATVKDFNDAIDLLIELMLAAETPEPVWESIKVHLGTEKAKLIFALAQVNRLGWIDIFNGKEIWRWKHTRLRDVIIGRWLAKNVLLSFDVSDPSKANSPFLADPGLAEAFALALVFLPENAREKALAALCKYQLLSLVEILQLNLFSRDSKLGIITAQILNQALINYEGKTQEFVESPESVIIYKLSWITNPLVLDVTDGLPKNWSWSVARLRNGDLSSGMLAIANHARSHEFLMGRFPFLEQAIKDFEQINIGDKTEVVNSLVKDLLNQQRLNAVFYIASILKWSELVEPLWDAWVNLRQESKLQSLAAMIWFLSLYSEPATASKLENALLVTLDISDKPESESMGSERLHSFASPLRIATAQPISDVAANVWAKTISENKELSKSIGYLLGGIDHPATLDAYLHLENKGFFSIWHETSESLDPMSDGLRDENRIKSKKTRDRLWEIILQESDQATRRKSLGFWSKTITPLDIPKLQSLPLNDPIFENALRLRLRLRDNTASSILVEYINKDPSEWIRFASMVPYEPGVFNAVITNLEKIPSEHGLYMVDSIFYRLPKEQVKQIVIAKEKLLFNSHEAWSALWLSGEENAIQLVIKAIKQVKQDEIGKLEHFFPLGTPTTITQKMLDVLIPVISYFPKDSLKWLAELTLRNGFEQWAIDHLGDVLKGVELRTFKWVYAENIINTLSDVAQYVPEGFDAVIKKSDLFGLEISYEHRNKYEYTANPVDAVKIWLEDSINTNKFIISARLLSKYGSVNDIDWWLSKKPNDEKMISAWNYALFHMKRKRWQIT